MGERRMRIIAGEFRGRPLKAPKGLLTRPTTDRVRESLFSTLTSLLGPGLDEAVVLDAFAGSGALGLEALSRGASRVVLVEQDRHALQALTHNVSTLRVGDRAQVVKGDVFSLLSRGVLPQPYSLLLLDPPYKLDTGKTSELLETLAARGGIEHEAVVSWEHGASHTVSWPEGFEAVAEKKYGDTRLSIAVYRRGPAQE